MKPITEGQCQQLIAFARIEISRWKLASDKQYMVELMEIALASLTAEAVAYVMGDETIDDFNRGYEFFAVRDKEGEEELSNLPLFTAPPAPVIKLPDVFDDYGPKFDEFRRGYNECIAEFKRLNGLGE